MTRFSEDAEIVRLGKFFAKIEVVTGMNFFAKLPAWQQLLLESKVNLTTFLLEKE